MSFQELKIEEHLLNLVLCLNYFDYSQSVGKSWVGRWVSGKWSVGQWVGRSVVGGSVVGGFKKPHLFQTKQSTTKKICFA